MELMKRNDDQRAETQAFIETIKSRGKKSQKPLEQSIKVAKTELTTSTDEQIDAEMLKELGEYKCLQADIHFYGFAPNSSKSKALKLYEESAELGTSKAMLALGSIYEKGHHNPDMARGGVFSQGAVEKPCNEPSMESAFQFYD